MILDSHCHAWSRWPYTPPVPDEKSRGAIELLLHELELHAVERAAVVAAGIDHNPDNLAYVAAARDRHPDRLLLFADHDCVWSDTYHLPGSAARLRELDDRFGLTGLAHYTGDRNDGWLLTDEADEVFATAAERQLLVSLGATPQWHSDLRVLAARYPTVPILCQSLAGVPARDGPHSNALNDVLASAELSNIYIKVAGFHYVSARAWDFPWHDAIAVLQRLYSAFGAERLCWGSDFPASTRYTTYDQSIEVIREHCPFFNARDLRFVFGETFRSLL